MKKTILLLATLMFAAISFAQTFPEVPFTSDSDHFSTTFFNAPIQSNYKGCKSYQSSYEKVTCTVSVYQENTETAKNGADKFIDYLKDKYGKKNLIKDKKSKLPNVKDDNSFFVVQFEGNLDNTAVMHVFMHDKKLFYIEYEYPSTMSTGSDIGGFMDFEMKYFDSFKFTN